MKTINFDENINACHGNLTGQVDQSTSGQDVVIDRPETLQKRSDLYLLSLCSLMLVVTLVVSGCSGSSQSGEENMEALAGKKYVVNGHLAPCPGSPNCVSSEDSLQDSHIAPIAFTGSASDAWQTLQEQILEMGGQIEEVDGFFLHATFRSSLFRFTDDVSSRLDVENNCIHIRSASRVGYSDFGVNRKRVEELRRRLASLTQER